MMDEYSNVQTDQITEVFKRAIVQAHCTKPDTRNEFAAVVLLDVIRALEQDRAIWPDIRFAYHYHANRFHQIPLSERG